VLQTTTGYRVEVVTVRKLEFETDAFAFADKVRAPFGTISQRLAQSRSGAAGHVLRAEVIFTCRPAWHRAASRVTIKAAAEVGAAFALPYTAVGAITDSVPPCIVQVHCQLTRLCSSARYAAGCRELVPWQGQGHQGCGAGGHRRQGGSYLWRRQVPERE
jgi:hypothetical protein